MWFVANVFPIGKETEKLIKKEISIYLWHNNFAEPIKRDILNFPVEKGGLGILNTQGPSQNTQWKILHEILPTKLKIHNWKKNRGQGAPSCAICGQTENTLHPVLFCKTARTVWRHFKGHYEKLITPKTFNARTRFFLIDTSHLPKKDIKAKLITTKTNIITTEFWKRRNLKTIENKNITSTKIIENVKKEIKYIRQIKYNQLAKKNNIKKFHELFSINNAISSESENTLVLIL